MNLCSQMDEICYDNTIGDDSGWKMRLTQSNSNILLACIHVVSVHVSMWGSYSLYSLSHTKSHPPYHAPSPHPPSSPSLSPSPYLPLTAAAITGPPIKGINLSHRPTGVYVVLQTLQRSRFPISISSLCVS